MAPKNWCLSLLFSHKSIYISLDIREHCRLIERTVVTKEPRFLVRVLRALFGLKKRLDVNVLTRVVNGYFTHSAAARDELLAFIPVANNQEDSDVAAAVPAAMDTANSEDVAAAAPATNLNSVRLRGLKSALTPLLPEVSAYIHLLIFLYLLENSDPKTLQCAEDLVGKLVAQNRRTLDNLAARVYYHYTMAHETLSGGNDDANIRAFLHGRLRTSTLRNDFEGQAVLINCLLRSYIRQNLIDQADKLVNKTNFPESASNNEWARYLFYLGRIKAIQLEYSDAHKHLIQSLRKAPQHSALGFKQTVQKLSIIVELLLGSIPERKVFLQKDNKRALAPYLAVTRGDENTFYLHIT